MKEVHLSTNGSPTPYVLQWATEKVYSGPIPGQKFVQTKCRFFVTKDEAMRYAARYLKKFVLLED